MDILTKYILDQEPTRVKAAKVPNQSLDDRMMDKKLDDREKKIDKMKKDTLSMKPPVTGLGGMHGAAESKIDKLTTIVLERNCGKKHTWNSLKNKCMPDPEYDEVLDDDIFGIKAAQRNAVNP